MSVQFNRRHLLAAIPAVGLAITAVPANAQETPIMALFRRYQELTDLADAYKPNDMSVTGEEMDRLFYDERNQVASSLMALPCKCVADFAAKLIVDTCRGSMFSAWETGQIWIEARALVA